MSDDNQNNDAIAFNTLKAVLRLGHESFNKGDLHSAAAHILNNTRSIVKYDRACLVNVTEKRAKVIAISTQSEVKHNSEYCIEVTELVKGLNKIDKLTLLTSEELKTLNVTSDTKIAFDYFEKNGEKVIVVPFIKPGINDSSEKVFWVIEYFNEIPETSFNIIHLLSLHYRESIWYYSIDRENILSKLFHRKKYFSPGRVILYLLVIFVVVSFFRISQNVVADFELVPFDEVTEYAPYDGMIESVNFKNGENVKKGDLILQYDTRELSYNLMETETKYEEIAAELDWVKQQSFDNKNQLGRVKILALQLKANKIEIDKTKWFLENALIAADISGVLVLNESEKWEGKAVKVGDQLFEIVPPKKINAEVMLNEINASVIGDSTKITLYLHSSPETPVYGKILSISPKPMLTKTGQFCYIIELKLDEIKPNFIVGMRGIARVKGEKVSIAYYLFKNIVLWWRKI